MTMENFLSYLQQLLTMVDSRNECSIALAKTALSAVFSLAKSSGMIIVAVVAEIIFPSKEKHIVLNAFCTLFYGKNHHADYLT